MNPIQSKTRIDFYMNLTGSTRIYFNEYAISVNDVIVEFIKEQMGDVANQNPINFQWNQRNRDNLFTLIKSSNPTVTPGTAVTNYYYTALPGTFPYPADYDQFVELTAIIDGKTVPVLPTTYNEVQLALKNEFNRPTNQYPLYNDNALGTGGMIWRDNSGSLTSITLTYLKYPTDFSIGQESNLIGATGVLTNALVYYAVDVSVYAGTTYQPGASITGTGAALTSGSVILSSLTSPIDLPASTHEEICKRAAAKILAAINMYDASAATDNEAKK